MSGALVLSIGPRPDLAHCDCGPEPPANARSSDVRQLLADGMRTARLGAVGEIKDNGALGGVSSFLSEMDLAGGRQRLRRRQGDK